MAGGRQIQAALLDLTCRRLDNLSSDSVAALLDLQTRAGLEETLATQWAADAAMVPHGRASVARVLGFLRATRIAPYRSSQE